ncbi:hypothetical protein OG394_16275 [Kribbella sp. NBC_01245]|uniref:hypothetical protein n=1 Tax=Kribbella sp. NBC_01245 TaxID=2903578 RepID=UPI002E2C35E6|nr:hypothetical protein [Kribbella sp. NBC_01245]
MPRKREFGAALAAVLLVSSCGGAVTDKYAVGHEPAHVEEVAGGLPRIVLEEAAVKRLAIETVPVVKSANVLVVPSAAVFVDPKGHWWVYTNPEPGVFVRHEIKIQRQAGDLAYLLSGPAVGTKVATVGVPSLYGVEEEIGH